MTTEAKRAPATVARAREPSRLDYIDGLRAIAVGLVLWFHAQLPGLPNGYLGVDIFFVVSGYLIPAQIIDQVRAGSFSIRDFYARRVLRIGPPLLVVVFSVLLLTCLLPLLPLDMTRIAWSAVASLGLSANWYFLQGFGYFAVASERELLLHLWSLAVEEQYYLVVPVAIVGLAYLSRRKPETLFRLGLICAVATLVVSLGVVFAFARSKPAEVFYATPLRAWEFAAGTAAILAMRCGLIIPRIVARAAVVAGLIAIAVATALPASEPGARLALQILSVLGAAVVLLCGAFANGGIGTALLCLRPVVGVGLVSYALYLWHWPLLAFWRLTHLDRPTTAENIVAGIAIPLLLAILTYVAIERPLRRWRQSGWVAHRRVRVIMQGVAASALLAAIAAGVVGWATHLGGTDRYRPYDEAGKRIMPDCPMGARGAGPLPACRLGGQPPSRVLLWGDSHALSASGAVAVTADETRHRADLLWDGGCQPLVGHALYLGATVWASCVNGNEKIYRWLASPSAGLSDVTGIVLGGAWAFNLGRAAPDVPRDEALRQLTAAMSVTLGKLRDLGLRVLVIGPVPTLSYPAPDCLFLSAAEDARRCGVPRADFDRTHADVVAALRAATSQHTNVRLIDPSETFCDKQDCWPGRDGQIYYSDTNHLSAAGARAVQSRFKEDFLWVFSAPERDRLSAK